MARDVTGDVAIQNTVRPGLLGTGLLGGADTRWGSTDRLGSTIGQAQGSRISQVVSYDVWGVPTFATAGVDSTTGFSGEVQDAGAGLVGFHARSYQPVTGSWLSADPYRGELGSPQTLGRYQYVGNNPATSRDLLGYQVPRMTMGGTGGVVRKPTVPNYPSWGGGSGPSVYTPWDAYKPTVRHETTCDAYDRRGTCIAHLTPQQRDQAQDIGAVIAGIGVGLGVTALVLAAAACTAVTFGVCGVAAGAAVFAFAAGGAAMAATTYSLSTGPKTTEGWAAEVTTGAVTGAVGGVVGSAATKVFASVAAASTVRTASAAARTAAAREGADGAATTVVNWGQQSKHLPGHPNYLPGRSQLTADPQLLAGRAGSGVPANSVPRGDPGFRERVDYGYVIGNYVSDGISAPTTVGVLHYRADGTIHIVPGRPIP